MWYRSNNSYLLINLDQVISIEISGVSLVFYEVGGNRRDIFKSEASAFTAFVELSLELSALRVSRDFMSSD